MYDVIFKMRSGNLPILIVFISLDYVSLGISFGVFYSLQNVKYEKIIDRGIRFESCYSL